MLRFANLDLVGWAVKTGMWVHSPLDAWKPATKTFFEHLKLGSGTGAVSLLATYAFVTAVLTVGVKLMAANVKKFIVAFSIIFFIGMACYTLGANAYIAANETQWAKQGIHWGMGLSAVCQTIFRLLCNAEPQGSALASETGQNTTMALPFTRSYGTKPTSAKRLSSELLRLSPMTKICPADTIKSG